MRLSSQDRHLIKQTIYQLDPQAQVYLFGSRVDDNKKGGDIDLLVLSTHLGFTAQRQIKLKLYELIGEQKIDLIIAPETSADPFVQLVLAEAVLL
ncbi:DNA polymerase subunit beta [Thioploca ingrica]|uniref:DNA polymerase subunit beta n=1 Tax=Thioploca ingrica TaxID=40754 RepID=A0A090AHI4_9GAMM|nr:DNA polymerase subunit beta [Thioploca ingrica]